jgi:hypothetical protein
MPARHVSGLTQWMANWVGAKTEPAGRDVISITSASSEDAISVIEIMPLTEPEALSDGSCHYCANP